MVVISSNELRPGTTLDLEGQLFTVVEFQHVQMGRGSAYVRTRLKNVKTGSVISKTFQAGEKLERAFIEVKIMQYLYFAQDRFVFMDPQSYEQLELNTEMIGEGKKFMKEGSTVNLKFYGDSPIGIELPGSVELKVTETDPGLRGDTVSGGSKPATLETGLVVRVPLFINIGDILKIDTRSGEYIERAGKEAA